MVGAFTLIGGFLFALDSSRFMIVEWVKTNQLVDTVHESVVRWPKYLSFGLLFLGIGLSLPLSEKVFPNKYPPLPQKEIFAKLQASGALNQQDFNSICLQKLADANALSIIQGRAVYPRYYAAGEGEKFTDSIGYKAVGDGRLVFDLVGQANVRYIFKISQELNFFPHASDVTLISSKEGELWFADVRQGIVERFYISDSFDRSMCR
jgi:hypothetical protein